LKLGELLLHGIDLGLYLTWYLARTTDVDAGGGNGMTFFGSTGSAHLTQPVVGIAPSF